MNLHELKKRRAEILAIAARHHAGAIRVFGSVARGEAGATSDVDFLARFESGSSLLNHAALKLELEKLLGARVDIASERGLKPKYRERILAEAIPL